MSRLPAGDWSTEPPACYDIRVDGMLDSRWSTWFEYLTVTSDADGQTVIAGPVADQAALHGLLAKICDLNLALISVRGIGP